MAPYIKVYLDHILNKLPVLTKALFRYSSHTTKDFALHVQLCQDLD